MGQITFARVGGPPADWFGVRVINLQTGVEVRDVVEVDTVERYLIRQRRDGQGELVVTNDTIETDRLEGAFEIRRPG